MVTQNRMIVAILTISAICASAAKGDLGVPISDPAPLNSNTANEQASDRSPVLAGDGNGNWIAVWELRDGPFGVDTDLLVARSIDDGANWSIPAPLNTNAATDLGNDLRPAVATDGQGHWVAIWDSNETFGNTASPKEKILVARSIDNGATWTSPKPLNAAAANDARVDQYAKVVSDGNGHWVAAWESQDDLGGPLGTDFDIFVARSVDNGENWSTPVPLNTDAAVDSVHDLQPAVAIDDSGRCIALWQGTRDGASAILAARSLDSGANWSNPIPLVTVTDLRAVPPSVSHPDVAMDNDGHCVAVFRSTLIPTVMAGAGEPRAAIRSFVLTARSSDGGASWSTSDLIRSREAADQSIEDSATVATDRLGNWVAVWVSDDSAGMPPRKSDILVARSADHGAHWSSPDWLNTDAETDNNYDNAPRLATDRHGYWLTGWHTPESTGGSDDEVFLARFALPDCNNNLIADSSEVLLGLLPDINFNHVPDICEIIDGPPPGLNGGCGVGLCGPGTATFAPLTLAGLVFIGRTIRRQTSGGTYQGRD